MITISNLERWGIVVIVALLGLIPLIIALGLATSITIDRLDCMKCEYDNSAKALYVMEIALVILGVIIFIVFYVMLLITVATWRY